MSSVMTSSTTSSNNKELTHLTPVNMNIIAAQEYLSACLSCLYVNQLVNPILWITYTSYISSCFYLESPKAMILSLETSVMHGTSYLLVLSHSRYSAHISLSLNHSDPQALNIWYYLSWLIITTVGYYYCFALFDFVSSFWAIQIFTTHPTAINDTYDLFCVFFVTFSYR